MNNQIKFVQCTETELKDLIKESVKQVLSFIKESNQQEPTNKLLTRKETCEILHINFSTLWKWTKNEKIPCHRIGNRVYYKLDEVQKSLTKSI